MYEGIHTYNLDELSAETAAYMTMIHPNYSLLAARIAVSNLHKETNESFAKTISELYNYIDNTGTIHFYILFVLKFIKLSRVLRDEPFLYRNLP